jgi:hypothetical protein
MSAAKWQGAQGWRYGCEYIASTRIYRQLDESVKHEKGQGKPATGTGFYGWVGDIVKVVVNNRSTPSPQEHKKTARRRLFKITEPVFP